MLFIPAIDIIDGQCVRLRQGDYSNKTIYHTDPLTVAKELEQAGVTHLHLVDLDGARARHIVNDQVLRRITRQTKLTVDFGGGIQSWRDLTRALESGASQVTVGSVAARNREVMLEWLDQYGPERLILGADAKDGYIAVHGWEETTDLPVAKFVTEYVEAGIQYVVCTDVARDGMLTGPATELYRQLLQAHPNLKLIASGGVSSYDDLEELRAAGLYGAIVGKAMYEGRIDARRAHLLCGSSQPLTNQ